MYQQQEMIKERKRGPVVKALMWGVALYAARFALFQDPVLDATYNLALIPVLAIDILFLFKVVVPLAWALIKSIGRGIRTLGAPRPEPMEWAFDKGTARTHRKGKPGKAQGWPEGGLGQLPEVDTTWNNPPFFQERYQLGGNALDKLEGPSGHPLFPS